MLPASDQKTGAALAARGGDGGGRRPPHEPAHQAPGLVGGGEQDREGGRRAQVVDVAGVDPPDERVDQPLDHRPAEPPPDDLAHGPVAEGRRPGARWGLTRSRATRSDSGRAARMPDRASGHHGWGPRGSGPRASAGAGPGPRWRRPRPPPGPARRSARARRRAPSPRAAGPGRRRRPGRPSVRRTAAGSELAAEPIAPPRADAPTGAASPSRSEPPTSSQAAARPAIPPPTTATVGGAARSRGRCRPGHRRRLAAAPAAPRPDHAGEDGRGSAGRR